MFSMNKLCFLFFIVVWSITNCLTQAMEVRKSKPLSTRRKDAQAREFSEEIAKQTVILKLLTALKDKLPQANISAGLNNRFLIHYLIAIGDQEVADELAQLLDNKKEFDAIASQIPFTKSIYDQAKELYKALSENNSSFIESIILTGRAKSFVLSAIANEAVYDGKFAIAELLFNHNVRFLRQRVGPLKTMSLLWFYQHGIEMQAPLDETTRLHSLINAAMANNKLVMRITITQSKPFDFERLTAVLITIAFGRCNLTRQLLEAYPDTYSNHSQMLITRAAALGSIPIIQMLLKALPASAQALQQGMEIAASRGHFPMVRFLVKNYRKEVEAGFGRAFQQAIAINHKEMMHYFASVIRQGEEPTEIASSKQTFFKEAVYQAAIQRHWQVFYWLIDQALSFEIPLNDLQSYCESSCKENEDSYFQILAPLITCFFSTSDLNYMSTVAWFGFMPEELRKMFLSEAPEISVTLDPTH